MARVWRSASIGCLAIAATAACGEAEPRVDSGGEQRFELNTAAERTLGFESLSDWSPLLPTTKLALSTERTQGSASLGLRGGGWMQVVSRRLHGNGPFPAKLSFEIQAPTAPVDAAWWGTVGLFMDAPASRVLPHYLGHHDLRSLGSGFHRVQFAVPESVRRKLSGEYRDLRLSIVVNAPLRERAAYLLDDFQLGEASPPVCTPVDDGNPCTDDACVAGVPVSTPRAPGTSCDADANLCTGAATCDGAGACLAGPVPELDDQNPCTVDSCHPVTGVSHRAAPDGSVCSDGSACTVADSCLAGACMPGAAVVCAPIDACRPPGVCQPESGQCSVPEPVPGCGEPPGEDEPLELVTLPPDFEPPATPPTAQVEGVALLDPNGVLPANTAMTMIEDELGSELADDAGGVRLEPSGALSGVAYLRVTLPAGAATSLPSLWTKTAGGSRYRMQAVGRAIAGFVYFPIRHFSDQRFALPPPHSTDEAISEVTLSDGYGVTPPDSDDFYARADWEYWSSGRAPASVSHAGIASFRTIEPDADATDPFPRGAGSRDSRTLVDDVGGIVKTPRGSVSLDETCSLGGDLLPGSARVSSGGQSVSWVVLGLDGAHHFCQMQLPSRVVSSCALPLAADDLRLSLHAAGSVSEDGRWLAFDTTAPLAADDSNGVRDVYLASNASEDACDIELAARDAQAQPLAAGSSVLGGNRTLSAHGRFVAFSSYDDVARTPVLWVRDRKRGVTRRAGGLWSPSSEEGGAVRGASWSLSDSGRVVAYRSEPSWGERTSNQWEPDYALRDQGHVFNVVDERWGNVWRHPINFARTTPPDACGIAGVQASNPLTNELFCESLAGPNGLALSGDGRRVVFLVADGQYSYSPSDHPEPQRYLQQRAPVPLGPAPRVIFPANAQELEPFEIVVEGIEGGLPRVLHLSGPDGDIYEAPLSYGSDGVARVTFPHGVAGGAYSATVLVEADGDLAILEARPAGGCQVAAVVPTADLPSPPLEYIEAPLSLSNLATFEATGKVAVYQDDELVSEQLLPFTSDTSVMLPRLAEGEYEARVFVRVLGKDRLRLALPFSVQLGLEYLGSGNSPTISDDGRLVAFCSSDRKLYLHDRPSRRTWTWDEPCHDARVLPDGAQLLVTFQGRLRLVEIASQQVVFEHAQALSEGFVAVFARLAEWPFSANLRYLAYELQVAVTGLDDRMFSVVVDRELGHSGYVVSARPNLNAAGSRVTLVRPSISYVNCDSDCFEPSRPMDLTTEFVLSACSKGCVRSRGTPPIPEHVCPYPPETCYDNPTIPLPETQEPIASIFHPDEILIQGANREGDLLYYQSPADWSGAWRSWRNDTASTYFALPERDGVTQGALLAGALVGQSAWLTAKHFPTPSLYYFAVPGSAGTSVLLDTADPPAPIGAPFVTPDRRLVAFSHSLGTSLRDAAGKAPVSVRVPPTTVAAGLFLARAVPQ